MTPAPSLGEAVRVWSRIGVLSFGGPAAQIALMHREVVEEKGWLSESQFLSALSFCMLLPGPEAMQLATYSGWRLHGTLGGLAAGLLFVLPGAVVILALSGVYLAWGTVPMVQAAFLGIKAAVLVIVLEALLRVARKGLKERAHWVAAALSFVALFVFALPFPLLILAAGLWGYASTRGGAAEVAGPAGVPLGQTARTVAIWGAIWVAPLILVEVTGGPAILTEIGVFFSTLATVTFGGAYAVLAYMAQDAVAAKGWLSAAEMVDGLGLAETTPGPLILVTEFVGILAAAREGGGIDPVMGLAGAAMTLWVTFAPCFLWIFAGAPYVEWLTAQRRLKGALDAITAAVVGVILNLSVWFALHVLFREVTRVGWDHLGVWLPDFGTVEPVAVALTGVAAILLLKLRAGIPLTLAVCAGLGMLGG
ncbi:chromate efflux transporter [Silicimonas algicola]|uniref:Chromate transporter n=1 Tax=Silicimonas algicola TaxID=1826607 RepID=A0A316G6Z1_9RHOB|nr:chromate efflux transporter [Silicimonas algicola]AZQ69360.1 chromate efflux transporter [Silicimonas algicola]PWK56423.1 chromate transporter [Silicimonas algicola]